MCADILVKDSSFTISPQMGTIKFWLSNTHSRSDVQSTAPVPRAKPALSITRNTRVIIYWIIAEIMYLINIFRLLYVFIIFWTKTLDLIIGLCCGNTVLYQPYLTCLPNLVRAFAVPLSTIRYFCFFQFPVLDNRSLSFVRTFSLSGNSNQGYIILYHFSGNLHMFQIKVCQGLL